MIYLHILRRLLFFFVLFAVFRLASADSYLGVDYHYLDPAVPQTPGHPVSVIEFFDYDCKPCESLSPQLFNWSLSLPAAVQFTSSPVLMSSTPQDLYKAQLYFSLVATGDEVRIRPLLLNAIQQQHLNYQNQAALTNWLSTQSVDIHKFDAASTSMEVRALVAQLDGITREYGVTSTPTVVVGGRYVITLPDTGSPSRFVQVVADVIARSLQEKSQERQ